VTSIEVSSQIVTLTDTVEDQDYLHVEVLAKDPRRGVCGYRQISRKVFYQGKLRKQYHRRGRYVKITKELRPIGPPRPASEASTTPTTP
jgi:hypothetical protein